MPGAGTVFGVSADNYLLIRRAGDRFVVSDESASAQVDIERHPVATLQHPCPIDSPGVVWFDDLDAARRHAHGCHSEYGIEEDLERDATGDTFAERLGELAAALSDTHTEHLRRNDGTAGTATLHIGAVTVTVAAADWDDVYTYAEWLSATTPAALSALRSSTRR